MKNPLIGFFLIYFAMLSWTVGAKAQLKVLEGNEISFGKIYQTGTKVHEVLTLKNTGTENISIKNVHTSCGCTVASVSDSMIAPGKQTTVHVEFNPAGYIGDVTKYIRIFSSDPKNQVVEIKMTGYVAYALQPTPNYIAFSNARVGKLDSTSITLSNTSDETMRITKVELPSEALTYKLDKNTLKPGEFTDLELYLNPKTIGDVNGQVQVFSTSKLQPVLQLKVFAGIIGR
ncbi:MAG: DUF1573 domain-containing protein [Candidatus Kryptoniota bacterium]